MKKNTVLILTSFLILFVQIGKAQKLDKPESISYDKKTKSYFVSNVGSGEIVKIDKDDKLSIFVSGYVSFLGIKLHKGVLYCSENKKSGDDFIRGFDKESGKLVFSMRIAGTKQLNDIEFDHKNNLYVSDRIANKVYKISIKNKSYEIIDSTIKTPNGLYFDNKNKRMLICNTIDSCSIYQYNIKSDKLLTIVNTSYPHLDGITIDKKGNIYVTSWSANWTNSLLLKYDSGKFTEVLSNKKGMADIEFNKQTNSIDIANYLDNSVTHLKLHDE